MEEEDLHPFFPFPFKLFRLSEKRFDENVFLLVQTFVLGGQVGQAVGKGNREERNKRKWGEGSMTMKRT